MSYTLRLKPILAGLCLVALAACKPTPPPAPPAPTRSAAALQWPKTRDGFIDEYSQAEPFWAVQQGRHEFDGKMPDLSAAGIAAQIKRLHGWRDQIAAADAATLEPAQRFERGYVLNVIDRDLFSLEKAQDPFKNPYWYLGAIDPDVYLSRDYAPLDQRMKAYIDYARTLPQLAADIGANLKGPLPRSYVELAVGIFGGFADFYQKDVGAVFAKVNDPELQKQLAAADAAAAQAMLALKKQFIAARKTATDQFAYGKELYQTMLADTEQVRVPVEQIEAAGKADLERNLAALKAECDVYLPGGTLKDCIAKEAADKPEGGAVVAARVQLGVLKAFVQQHDLVSIPSTMDARVAEAPPYNRGNLAFIQVPGPFDHEVAAVYNITPANPAWTPAEQAAYVPGKASLMFVSSHEVWPGHFLQFLHSNANPSKVEGLWVGYAFAEGWAHYCEEMMIEAGFGKGDPAMHIGQIQMALLRDVRLLSSIGLHTHGMTQAESEKMFRDSAFADAGNARQQAARGTYDPGYLNYTLGKLMIRKLRADWVAKMTAGQAAPSGDAQLKLWHDFHDKFLSYGGPPIPMLRAELLGDDSPAL
jgi:hypothetical protein